ncbi:MAG: LysM peptidoglycan-binding domain-containing protein [Gammaproteobacteria bacterium]|nr:LysM peptidoglycan-binding domain-containing protein [Gammaproteobacteria bacterium]
MLLTILLARAKQTRWILVLLGLAALPLRAQSPDLFPQPPQLKPAVDFWIRVYTEVNTQSGFLHDARNLSVIYERLDLNRNEIERVRTNIRDDLAVLASGKRDGLTVRQQNILDLWPVNVSNQTLETATSNVRWQLGQSDRFLGGLRRSGAYKAHINEVIGQKNLPFELGVLPHVESSFNPSAYSSAAAAGMWQFTPGTGKRFMRIDYIVDERMDPYTSTSAAMSLLEYNYSVLGTWPLALTAYNHGAGGISRAVRETGTTDIEEIIANYRGRRFGFASRNFYPQFLAVVHVENNAERYFGDVSFDSAPKFQEIRTDAFIDAEVFASSIGVSFEQLSADNPALRPIVWEGNKRIPQGYPVKIRENFLNGVNVLSLIPSDYKFAVQTPDIAYVVERGDSLSLIAGRFNTSVSRLVSLNQLASRHRIQIGQRILLPQDDVDPNQLIAAAAGIPPPDGLYKVQRGDTVSRIAARYNIKEADLLDENGISNPQLIYPGQQVRLPGFLPSGTTNSSLLAQTDLSDEIVESEEADRMPSGLINDANPEEDLPGADRLQSQSEEPAQLAINTSIEELSSGDEVFSDERTSEQTVTLEEEQAIALDPEIDVMESDERLTESLSADPSDYTVADNNSIEIQASETLGHYADWLGIRAWDIRRLNNMAYRDPVIIGERITLSFSKVVASEFELRRKDYHVNLQQEFFASYRIQGVENYKVKSGDNVGGIARRRYAAPIWLLRQYNPDLDFNRIQIGQEIIFPILEQVD